MSKRKKKTSRKSPLYALTVRFPPEASMEVIQDTVDFAGRRPAYVGTWGYVSQLWVVFLFRTRSGVQTAAEQVMEELPYLERKVKSYVEVMVSGPFRNVNEGAFPMGRTMGPEDLMENPRSRDPRVRAPRGVPRLTWHQQKALEDVYHHGYQHGPPKEPYVSRLVEKGLVSYDQERGRYEVTQAGYAVLARGGDEPI